MLVYWTVSFFGASKVSICQPRKHMSKRAPRSVLSGLWIDVIRPGFSVKIRETP